MLGGGSFGEVHKAVNLKTSGECAIKIYQKRSIECNPNSEVMKQLLTEELTQLQYLNHPHIVHILELIEDYHNYYFVMELIPHGNLLDVLKKSAFHDWKLTSKEAAKMI